jgi:hypothetical protein
MKIKTQLFLMLAGVLLCFLTFTGGFAARLLWWIAVQGWQLGNYVLKH